MSPLEQDTRQCAIEFHGDQKYGEHPYIFHLDEVAKIVEPYKQKYRSIVQVAYLHDIIEDTQCSAYDIAELFEEHVADCVRLLTDQHGPNRKTRKYRTNQILSWIDCPGPFEEVLIVKAADRLANMRFSSLTNNTNKMNMYSKEFGDFSLAVYRDGLCNDIWEQLTVLS